MPRADSFASAIEDLNILSLGEGDTLGGMRARSQHPLPGALLARVVGVLCHQLTATNTYLPSCSVSFCTYVVPAASPIRMRFITYFV